MRCFRCGSVLSDADYCESCGIDVSVYKKIVKLSNTYYNMGLAKARNRDLSGAADLLRRSVRIDKNNINARNLLGLVYFEMGECVQALSEWVISKNIKPDKNLADEYLKDIQSNPNKLNTMNQTIRKYNKALGYAADGSDDLAIIQLKKVLSTNPNLIKAHQFLALLYLKKGENEKARRTLLKADKIDKNNTLTLRYLKEAEKAIEAETGKKPSGKDVEEKKALSGNDVIIPHSTYKETNYALVTFINVIIGVVIGAAMVYFLVTPAKENTAAEEYRKQINDYAADLDKANSQIEGFNHEIESLQAERDRYQQEANQAADIVASSENTEKLIKVASKYYTLLAEAEDELSQEACVELADDLMQIENIESESEEFIELYGKIKEACIEKAGGYYYNIGAQYTNNNDWANAEEAYRKCVAINDMEPSYLYRLAKSIVKKNNDTNTEESIQLFNRVIEIAPNSEYAGYSANYLN